MWGENLNILANATELVSSYLTLINEKGMKDAVEFGPFLIVNGKPLEIVGDPWGRSPRVAIAQRKDGVVLFLVIDGENYIMQPPGQLPAQAQLRFLAPGQYQADVVRGVEQLPVPAGDSLSGLRQSEQAVMVGGVVQQFH